MWSGFLFFLIFFTSLCLFPAEFLPNIIIILLDDAGYSDFGGINIPTPHIDSISKNGVDFRNAYVTAPQCSPSRVSLLTGRYQQHFGHETNSEYLVALSHQSTRIIPQFLPKEYHSGLFGKWNLGDLPNPPQNHGFHHSLLYRHLEEFFASNISLPLKGAFVRGRDYSTSLIFQSAIQFIQNQTTHIHTRSRDHNSYQNPFFLYLAPMSPHVPHVYPPTYSKVFDNLDSSLPVPRRKVLTMMSEIDEGVGSLLHLLDQQNIRNNTLLILINDNGAPMIPRSNINSNHPLRGFKGELYEGGIHVKYSLQWPSVISSNQVIHSPVSTLDILPTILQLFPTHNLPQSIVKSLDGESLLPLLKFDQPTSSSAIEATTTTTAAAAVNNTKTISSSSSRNLFWRFLMNCKQEKRAMRKGDLKWLKVGEIQELYDMSTDPFETLNVANEFPEVVKKMELEFSSWESQFPPIHGRVEVHSKASCL